MQQTLILYPLFFMVFLIFGVSFWSFYQRIQAVKAGLTVQYFKFNIGLDVPEDMRKADQHYVNLFEMPILFFVAILTIYATQTTGWGLLVLAWAYVILRAAHSYIHLTSNKVLWRMRTFLGSAIVLLMMWFGVMLKVTSL